MDFLSGYIKNFRRKPATECPATQVVEVKPEEYIHHKICVREECLFVYQVPESEIFEVVFQRDTPSRGIQTAFRFVLDTQFLLLRFNSCSFDSILIFLNT